MRALLILRPNAATRPGGDVVHAESTASALRLLGVEANIVRTFEPDARGYDVAHVFGVFEPSTATRQIASLAATRTPLVLSPIWLDLGAFFAVAPRLEAALGRRSPGVIGRRLARIRTDEQRLTTRGPAARVAERRRAEQRALMQRGDVLLPASNIEAYLYSTALKLSAVPFVVAPVGVERRAFELERPAKRTGLLCCARIEPKKNQAALLYAVRDVDVDVTLVGQAHDARYLALCKKLATPRVRFVDHVRREEAFALMARTAVHVHPSWFESPGLSSLEAAAAGAHLVVGDRGTEREYFEGHVEYADPADPGSIHAAVVRALDRPPRYPGDPFECAVRSRTWERTAEATLEAYERAIAVHG